jgi:putative transposase
MSELIASGISTREACRITNMPRPTWYRWFKRKHAQALSPAATALPPRACLPRADQAHALRVAEREAIIALCNSERFCNSAPRAICATLLDEGRYLASPSTVYRILGAQGQVRERRSLAAHPARVKPELVATAPNELWSWDVTKLQGPAKWTWYSLYLILDVFSRYIIDWTVASVESTAIARALFSEAAREHGVQPEQLHVHADGGAIMKAKSLALLFADLGISKSHSRPHVSNDNPYSEAQFKTLKYRPEFPDFFPSPEAARAFMVDFVHWYNHEHHHSGLSFLTPADVHFGRAQEVLARRDEVMQRAWQQHPRRFHPNGPASRALPSTVYINKPMQSENGDQETADSSGSAQTRSRDRVEHDSTAHQRGIEEPDRELIAPTTSTTF